MQEEVLIYGNGGHAQVVKDLITKSGNTIAGIFDHHAPYTAGFKTEAKMTIAIGNNETRERISKEVTHRFATLVHPTAVIGEQVSIGEGTVVLANAVIQSHATIGRHCIINAGVVIDHDAVIEDFVSIYPSAYIGGGATVTRLKTVLPNQVVKRETVF